MHFNALCLFFVPLTLRVIYSEHLDIMILRYLALATVLSVAFAQDKPKGPKVTDKVITLNSFIFSAFRSTSYILGMV